MGIHINQFSEEKRRKVYEIIARAYTRNKEAIDTRIIQELEQKIISVLLTQGTAMEIQEISKLTDIEQKHVLMVLNKSDIIKKVGTSIDISDTSVRFYVN